MKYAILTTALLVAMCCGYLMGSSYQSSVDAPWKELDNMGFIGCVDGHLEIRNLAMDTRNHGYVELSDKYVDCAHDEKDADFAALKPSK